MTQPIMEAGRWAVLMNGVSAGKLQPQWDVAMSPDYPWYVTAGGSFTKTGRFYAYSDKDSRDIAATFTTEAEAEAFAATINPEKEPVMSEPTPTASDIEWASLGVEDIGDLVVRVSLDTDADQLVVSLCDDTRWTKYFNPENALKLAAALKHFAGRAQRNGGGE